VINSSTDFSADYASLASEASMSGSHRYDWAARLVETTDSFGKLVAYGYNDADEQIYIADLANGKVVDYRYDALSRRIARLVHCRTSRCSAPWRNSTACRCSRIFPKSPGWVIPKEKAGTSTSIPAFSYYTTPLVHRSCDSDRGQF
jgi:YD repeat-containing protein